MFRNPEGDFAGRLIEQCGLKGFAIGAAVVSDKHANFIINSGKASAADVEALILHVQATVAGMTGIRLEPEVRIIGEAVGGTVTNSFHHAPEGAGRDVADGNGKAGYNLKRVRGRGNRRRGNNRQ